MMIWINFVLRYFVWIFLSDLLFGHFLANTGIQLAQLRPLPNCIALFVEPFCSFDCSEPC